MELETILGLAREGWQPAALTVAVFLVAWVVRFLVYHSTRRLLRTQAAYVASAIQFGIIVGGLYGTAIYFEINPTTILAVVAIATAGIALAAENAIANMIAGAVILASGKFAVGEYVTVAGTTGQVESIGFANVTVSSNTRGLVTIPNVAIVGDSLINHSRLPAIEMSLVLPFFNSHDRKQVGILIRKVLFDLKLDTGCKVLHDWTAGGETWIIVVKVAEYKTRRETMSKLSVALTNALQGEGFPLGAVTFYKET